MPSDLMRYDVMAREALRGVVKTALKRVAREGLPGQHHFYITFATQAPGVDIDPELLARYPEEMTVVLEHQFWDLHALDDAFEVTLKFGGAPKYLRVPYSTITRFHDPSVGFALQFGGEEADAKAKEPKPKIGVRPEPAAPQPEDKAAEAGDADGEDRSGAVVSLDAFRRK